MGPLEDLQGCARYTLLGPVVEGRLDQVVSYEEDSLEALGCIRLLVLEAQESWLGSGRSKSGPREAIQEEEAGTRVEPGRWGLEMDHHKK